MTESIHEQIGTVTAIESEAHFVKVCRKMLRAETMPRAHDAALQKRKGILDGVRVNVSHDVNATFMSNRFVLPWLDSSLFNCERIGRKIIGENNVYIFTYVLADVLGDRSGLGIAGVKHAEITVALANADYDFLCGLASADAMPKKPTAHIGFVHLDFSGEHRLIHFVHCGTDAMAEIPRCFVTSDPERALNLARRDALLGLTQKHGGREPIDQWQVSVIENSSGEYGELIVAVFAVEKLLFCFKFDYICLAPKAARAFGPAEAYEHLPALFVAGEHGMNIH